MLASPSDATVPEIVHEFVWPAPKEAERLRTHAVKVIELLREMGTDPVLAPNLTDDDLRFCLDRMSVITPMFHGAAVGYFEKRVATDAPDLVSDFRDAKEKAIAGARAVKIVLWEELLRRTPEEDEESDPDELREIAEARADDRPGEPMDEVYRRLGL